MASQQEKIDFRRELGILKRACDQKANDGTLTDDQRSTFIVASYFLHTAIGAAKDKDFAPIPSNLTTEAIREIREATIATSNAADDETVLLARNEIRDAESAIINVLGPLA